MKSFMQSNKRVIPRFISLFIIALLGIGVPSMSISDDKI